MISQLEMLLERRALNWLGIVRAVGMREWSRDLILMRDSRRAQIISKRVLLLKMVQTLFLDAESSFQSAEDPERCRIRRQASFHQRQLSLDRRRVQLLVIAVRVEVHAPLLRFLPAQLNVIGIPLVRLRQLHHLRSDLVFPASTQSYLLRL